MVVSDRNDLDGCQMASIDNGIWETAQEVAARAGKKAGPRLRLLNNLLQRSLYCVGEIISDVLVSLIVPNPSGNNLVRGLGMELDLHGGRLTAEEA